MVLTRSEAQAYYDRFGKKQDTQAFYEDPALDELAAQGAFEQAMRVFELGCGTGRFAARLLADHLSASYQGIDLSPVMVDLARERLARFGERAQVALSDGRLRFPLADESVDRVVSSYVLDLLSEEDIQRVFEEAHRVLVPAGMLCLVSLCEGVGFFSRIVAGLWKSVYRMRASLIGGCRPIRLEPFVEETRWKRVYQHVVTPFGVPSEVLIVVKRST